MGLPGTTKKRLTIAQKTDILEKLSHPGATQSSVARSMNVSRKTIQNTLAHKALLREYVDSGASTSRSHIKVDQKFQNINEATFRWFQRMRVSHGEIPIVESVICKKAMQIADNLGTGDFRASKGWFRCWQERHGLNIFKVCGEKRDVPVDNVEEFLKSLPGLLAGYEDKDVFNADETALYYRALPRQTLEKDHSTTSGRKVPKERVTVLLCGSMQGEKMSPLVIGKYKAPRCFKGVDLNKLPSTYKNTKNAWMTNSVFHSWLTEVNRRMASQRRKIVIFVDNATSHRPPVAFSNIKLLYLPANCTSVLQPMDQGVIWSFKCKFRQLLLDFVIDHVENELDGDILQRIDLFRALQFTKQAWNQVHPDVLVNSFRKAGFGAKLLPGDSEEEAARPSEELSNYETVDDIFLQQELDLMSNELTADSEEWNISSACYNNPQDDEEEEPEGEIIEITIKDASNALRLLKHFAISHSAVSERLIDCTVELNSIYGIIMNKLRREKQLKIYDFFHQLIEE